jgi:hypothetical protein
MAIYLAPLVTFGAMITHHLGVPGSQIRAYQPPVIPSTAAIVIVILAILISAFVQVARGLASLYCELTKMFAAMTFVLLSILLIAGVSVALVIHL